ncbi:hypothetical protein SUGI_1170860 [Cryptomeria japonica]|nr:hypothetical protein SUGI_1170860 [Cryptomeria japonica]
MLSINPGLARHPFFLYLFEDYHTYFLMFLLQPAPETFNLFNDILLLSEGHIVYHGPRENVLEFFLNAIGFKCPKRKGTVDFL